MLYTSKELKSTSNQVNKDNYEDCQLKVRVFIISDMATYQATNSEYYEDINDAPIISSSTEVPSTQEPLYTTIEESTDSNSNLTESNANGDVITTDDYYYVNEGMGGINEVTMKTNNAYGTTKQPQLVANPSSVSHDPLTILNPAYDDVTTTNNHRE